MECAVAINIHAKPRAIWSLLTDAARMPQWNSTVLGIDGHIAPGERIALKSTLDPKRTFNLKVGTFDPPSKMVWQDGMAPMFKGVRTYTLTPRRDGSTDFTMTETLTGLMLPLIARSLPDFRPSFEQFALDLKQASERKEYQDSQDLTDCRI